MKETLFGGRGFFFLARPRNSCIFFLSCTLRKGRRRFSYELCGSHNRRRRRRFKLPERVAYFSDVNVKATFDDIFFPHTHVHFNGLKILADSLGSFGGASVVNPWLSFRLVACFF